MSRHGRRILAIIFIQAAFQISFGQVANNNIDERTTLVLDAGAIASTTNFNTVEWDCVNRALTSKCLVYHNDQWFQFRVKNAGKYYLNISSQNCRDGKGVQAIVIEGNPCAISTYKILHCIPQLMQYDVFVEIDSIKPNFDYLLNIDGFLGDHCSFGIALSSKPMGLSFDSRTLDTVQLSVEPIDNIIKLTWITNQLLVNELEEFEIYRKDGNASKYKLRGKVLVETNTVGVGRTIYSFADTLTAEGKYGYELIGNVKGGLKQILSRHSLNFFRENLVIEQTIKVVLDYKNGTEIQILLLDGKQDQILRQSSFEFNKEHDANQKINVGYFLNLGINNFVVRVINLKTHDTKNYNFDF